MTNRPILVTGSQRSGTTWVGRILAVSRNVGYIWEPFHLAHDIGECAANFEFQNTLVSEVNEHCYLHDFERMMCFRYNLREALSRANNQRSRYRVARSYVRFGYHQLRRSRPLLKDPRAVFSAEWLAARFGADVIVTIRHPAAFAASMKIKGWSFPFQDTLKQPLLMEQYLAEFSSEISTFAKREHDLVDQAALLWKLVYHVVSMYQHRHPEWLYVRNEDLSNDPVEGFRRIFAYVGLDYSRVIQDHVRWHSGLLGNLHESKPERNRAITDITRDSVANIQTWKERLTADEVLRVRRRTSTIAEQYYRDDDW